MFTLLSHMLHFTDFSSSSWSTYFQHIPLNIAYSSVKYWNTYPINIFHKSRLILYIVLSNKQISQLLLWTRSFLPSPRQGKESPCFRQISTALNVLCVTRLLILKKIPFKYIFFICNTKACIKYAVIVNSCLQLLPYFN